MNRTLIEKIEEIFRKKLNAKSGWGKNEVLLLYKDSVSEAVLFMWDKIEKENNIK